MAEDPQTPRDEKIVEATAESVVIDEPAEVRARRNRIRMAWVGGAALVLIGGAAAVVVLWPELLRLPAERPKGVAAARVEALSQDVAGIRKDLEAVMTSVRALAAAGGDGPAAGLAGRVEALEKTLAAAGSGVSADSVEALAGRVRTLEERPAPDLDGVKRAVDTRIDALASTVEARGKEVATLAAETRRLADAVAALTARVDAMQEAANANNRVSGRVAALVLAAGQLRAALARTDPFTAELDALAALAQDDEAVAAAVAALRPYAAAGIPTQTMLAARFDPMARAVVRAAIAPGDGGWWDRALARLAALVTVRPTGTDVPGDSPAAKVARSEARLASGDLAGAVAALAGLAGAPARAAADWLAGARARLAADRATAALGREVIGRIPAPRSDGAPDGG